MPVCLIITNSDVIKAPIDQTFCHLYGLTPAEIADYQALLTTANTDLYTLLSAVFSTPDSAQIIAAFMAAMTLPLIVYMAAAALGSLVNFFR